METGVMRHRASRSAAPHEVTAEAAREDVAPGWWQRIWRRVLPPPEAALSQQDQVDQLNRQLTLLEGARAELEAGWVQGAWWAVSSAVGHVVAAGDHTGRVDGVCLVGALVRAGRGASDENPDTGRAVDAVYDVLWASRGQPATPAPRMSGILPPVSSPQVRLARVRTLTQWNDRPRRTKAEVLTLVDHAISAAILALASAPRPDAPHPDAPHPDAPHPETRRPS